MKKQPLYYHPEDRVTKTLRDIHPGEIVVVRYKPILPDQTCYEYIGFVKSIGETDIQLSSSQFPRAHSNVPTSELSLDLNHIGYLMPMQPAGKLTPIVGNKEKASITDFPNLNDYNIGHAVLLRDYLLGFNITGFVDQLTARQFSLSSINQKKVHEGITPNHTHFTLESLAKENLAIAPLVGKTD